MRPTCAAPKTKSSRPARHRRRTAARRAAHAKGLTRKIKIFCGGARSGKSVPA